MTRAATPTALIADDESLLREDLRDKLAALWPELHLVAEASNGNEAAALIAEHAPDIAFLDIKMPGLSGIEVAQGIETDTRVVFVTAFDQFAVDAFEREAVDYLLKPVTRERLAQTVARLRAALAQPPASAPAPELAQLLDLLARAGGGAATAAGARTPLRWIRASRGDTTYQIAVDEVLYFQSDDKYTIVYTANGEHVIRMPLAELVAALDGEHFWQVHRGTIVNVRNVLSSKRDGDGRVWLNVRGVAKPLTVSRAYQHRFRQM
ncbi:MAG: LytTR family DNA-binding domain-containing protein [Burkholderiales bacterium]|nr:LytTR family DNA-binding domain-containing protein [Burkholderiales bacterium]